MKATAVLRQLKNIAMTIFTNPAEVSFAKARIHRHYNLKGLEKRGVQFAEVRPTEWHGEGGRSGNNTTGHLTVDWQDQNGNHVTTHHVYKDDDHYW